ncbi:phosphohistidine phosphatase SixA [Methylomonas sp. AM2-LC]|uniref:phosphohistidine phosphatase SixA n=1 Tax=Methylomonas sp. AM2-LC TaxID=3153301 RepID=UPI003264DECD
MLITLLRHANAEDRSLTVADEKRILTEKGIKQSKRVADFCESKQLLPEILLSSPLTRAEQTAKIVQKNLKACPEVTLVTWLENGTPLKVVVAELGKLAEQQLDNIWLVGHEPDFSELIAYLLQSKGDHFSIKKASLTSLDVCFTGTPTARLLWSIPCSLIT